MAVSGTPTLDAAVQADAPDLLARERSETRPYRVAGHEEPVEVFIETFPPPPTLLIFGAVHVAQPLSRFAKALGFDVIVSDARAKLATTERFPDADRIIQGWPDETLEQVEILPNTYVAILSHDPKFDEPALVGTLSTPAAYIGAIGSRSTNEDRRRRLAAAGMSPEQVARMRAPIGLDIGAATPEEMAISILGEIIALRRGRSGGSLTHATGRIRGEGDPTDGDRTRGRGPDPREQGRRGSRGGAVIAGIVLAAGRSSRLGRPKQLLPVHGEPLIRHTLRRVLASSLDQVILVVGHEADVVRDAVAGLPVECVFNPDAAAGQSTSVRAGLAALSPEVEAAVFILGDQPGVDPKVIDALIAAWRDVTRPGRRPSLRGPDGQPGPVRPAGLPGAGRSRGRYRRASRRPRLSRLRRTAVGPSRRTGPTGRRHRSRLRRAHRRAVTLTTAHSPSRRVQGMSAPASSKAGVILSASEESRFPGTDAEATPRSFVTSG